MPAFQTASYYTKPWIDPKEIGDFGPNADQCLRQIIAHAIGALLAQPQCPPSAHFAHAFTGDPVCAESPDTLLVSFPLVNPDEPAELLISLEAMVEQALYMHQDPDEGSISDPVARDALDRIARMLGKQAERVRDALALEPDLYLKEERPHG